MLLPENASGIVVVCLVFFLFSKLFSQMSEAQDVLLNSKLGKDVTTSTC